ncbi:hypothetical protein HNQ91_002212 [Filimonas zeae]|nr:carboxypeptidase-like regulatory domain-containing protein [Filimonas zeae]MDR6339161.1 hypothetical protein [Filimonas zeae]
MKLMRVSVALCCMGTLFYLGCQKSASLSTDPGPYTPEPGVATISGRVTDERKMPVSGAVVKAGATGIATTDVDGRFTIKNVSIDKKAGAIRVEKDSFFTGVKTLVVGAGNENNVAVQLLRKKVAGTFSAASGGTVTLPSGGGKVAFPAEGVMNEATKAAYTGTVTTSAFFFDPTAAGFENIIPGALRGLDSNNRETGLQSFSMIAVELTGANGQKLQLAAGKTATITFAIPAGLRAQAPATIPLWYLNETTGLWKEEGRATRQGNTYVGTVTHFSYWNCDAPFELVDFSAIIKAQSGDPLPNAKVVLQATGAADSLSIYGSGLTGADGYTGGKVPAGRTLKMQVLDKCGNLLYSKIIGPFTGKADLGNVTVTYNGGIVTFSGTAVNCSDAPITNGYVTITLDGAVNRATVTNGSFSLAIPRCISTAATASVVAYDLVALAEGTAKEVAVNGTTVNAGQLKACGTSLEQFFTYSVNGVEYNFTAPADSMYARVYKSNTDSIADISVYSSSPYTRLSGSLRAASMQPGTKTFDYFSFYREGGSFQTGKVLTATITENSKYLAGTISGTVADSSNGNQTYSVTGKFRMKRQ